MITDYQKAIYNKRLSQGEDARQAAFAAMYWTRKENRLITSAEIERFVREMNSQK